MSPLMFQLLPANPEESINASFRFVTQTHAEDLLIAVVASYNYNRDFYYDLERLATGDLKYGGENNKRQINLRNKKLNLIDAMTFDDIEKSRLESVTMVTETIVLAANNYKPHNSKLTRHKKMKSDYIFSISDSNAPSLKANKIKLTGKLLLTVTILIKNVIIDIIQ